MEEFGLEHLHKMKRGISLFNTGKFWQCHEELEDIWREEVGEIARHAYWAVIQVATTLYHYHNRSLNGASGQVKKAKKKFAFCERRGGELKILEQNLNWSILKSLVMAVPDGPKLQDFEKLSAFKFKDPELWDNSF